MANKEDQIKLLKDYSEDIKVAYVRIIATMMNVDGVQNPEEATELYRQFTTLDIQRDSRLAIQETLSDTSAVYQLVKDLFDRIHLMDKNDRSNIVYGLYKDLYTMALCDQEFHATEDSFLTSYGNAFFISSEVIALLRDQVDNDFNLINGKIDETQYIQVAKKLAGTATVLGVPITVLFFAGINRLSDMFSYCSWCYEKTWHSLKEQHFFKRNVYQCNKCDNYTLKCRFCDNMAKGNPKEFIIDKDLSYFKNIIKTIGENWDNELCAEHDGSIASFEKLSVRLDDLVDYNLILERKKYNLQKAAILTGCMIGGTAVFGPIAHICAPIIAIKLGTAGYLGAVSGTAISTLHGAALANASLAAIGLGSLAAGGFGMAGGVICVTAVGAGLGAYQGGVISNNYFGNIKDFKIQKVNEGRGPALLFLNGFLSEKNQDSQDWQNSVKTLFINNPWYFTTWEASSLVELNNLFMSITTQGTLPGVLKQLISSKDDLKKHWNPLAWPLIIKDIIANPWHTAMVKAMMAGILIADLIARTNNEDGFTLMGHSLGTRIIYYALKALSTRENNCIKDVYLLGGTVDRTDVKGWETVAKAVDGNIYNCHSSKDLVLKYLCQPANLFFSKPIGLGPIEYKDDKIKNINVTDLVSSHMEYKDKFEEILNIIHATRSE